LELNFQIYTLLGKGISDDQVKQKLFQIVRFERARYDAMKTLMITIFSCPKFGTAYMTWHAEVSFLEIFSK